MMRITEVSTYDPRGFGGLETVVRELSKQFSGENEVSIVYQGEDGEADFGKLFPVKPFFPKHLTYNLKHMKTIHETDPDLVHGHGQNGLGMFLRRKLLDDDTPFVMTFHGTYAGLERVRNQWRTIPLWNPLTLLEKWAGQTCDRIVACSEKVKYELITYYNIPEEKITVIRNGVDMEEFHPSNAVKAKQQLGLESEQKYLSWVGHEGKNKGLDEAINIVKQLPEYKLLAAGVDRNNTGQVKYLGNVAHKYMIHVYNASKGFIFPTKYEGGGPPLVIMEAFATQTPVITTKAGNVEITEKGENYILLEDINVEEIPDLLEKERDFSFIEDYTWEKVADRYLKVLREASR